MAHADVLADPRLADTGRRYGAPAAAVAALLATEERAGICVHALDKVTTGPGVEPDSREAA